jgi:N-acyl-D-aspartate/D-glutamate deacylase
MKRRDFLTSAIALGATARLGAQPAALDLVISRGRVIDPSTRFDAIADVGIRAGRVVAISRAPLRAPRTIDARGLVVAPGFIDLHAHGQDLENNRVQAMDGVTTALELETGPADVPSWYAERAGARMLNYGACVGHIAVRNVVMSGRPTTGFNQQLDLEAAKQPAGEAQVREIVSRVEQGLRDGALSVGFGVQYVPGTSRLELLEVFRAAARVGAMCGVHQRYAGIVEPDGLAGVEELVAAAAATGAHVHIEHITSNTARLVREALRVVEGARARGVHVTCDTHPYTAAMTRIETAVFDPGWQERFQISHGDLEWAATGERLTEASFTRYRAEGGSVVIHMMREDDVTAAVSHPLTAIISDGELTNGRGHPRSSGTFCRVLGRYVRERRALSLPEAIRKMTHLPAQVLEARVPAMRRKGRLVRGADADVIVFDPATVIDQADYTHPARPSVGMRHVLVHGEFVVRDGALVEQARPGRPVRAMADT